MEGVDEYTKEDVSGALSAGSGLAQGAVASTAQLLGFQADAQRAYQRREAIGIAIQATARPIAVDQLLKDADRIAEWLSGKTD